MFKFYIPTQVIMTTEINADIFIKYRKILLFTSKSIIKKEYFKKILALIGKEKIIGIVVIKQEQNYLEIKELAHKYNTNVKKIDLILALGGGSVIDSAKLMSILYYDENINLLKLNSIKKSIDIITIPTKIGSGSEFNRYAVINDKNKIGITLDEIYPKLTIINPKYIDSNKKELLCGIIDSTVHLFERYFSKIKFEITQDFIIILYKKLLMLSYQIINSNKIDDLTIAELAWISNLSNSNFIEIGQKADWSSHRIAHAIGAYYGYRHCKIIGIVFFSWLIEIENKINLEQYNINELKAQLFFLINEIDNDIKIKKKDYNILVDIIINDMKSGTIGNFVTLDKTEIKNILKRIKKWKNN